MLWLRSKRGRFALGGAIDPVTLLERFTCDVSEMGKKQSYL